MRSSKKLNDYLRVNYPGIYIVIAVLILALAGVIIWGCTGRLRLTETVNGIVLTGDDGVRIICTVDAPSYQGLDLTGAKTSIKMPDGRSYQGMVAACPKEPVSAGDFAQGLALPESTYEYSLEWLNLQLLNGNYVYPLTVTSSEVLDAYTYQLAEVTINVSEILPISFLKY